MQRTIDTLILHCSATTDGRPHTASDIRRWHTDSPPSGRGWRDIGYHFVIRTDGTIEPGRPVATPGAHAQGHNAHSLGICLVGTRRFSKPQWESLRLLVVGLLGSDFPGAAVIGHRDVEPLKECPGFEVRRWLDEGMKALPQHLLP
ncbi:MAG: N-acetylmuramoyl-L-alanine amidase [Magnetococcales bacterium]|nr:N-acetylmuramoyl-L-alanine amidase [Magnetococcales bacterium]